MVDSQLLRETTWLSSLGSLAHGTGRRRERARTQGGLYSILRLDYLIRRLNTVAVLFGVIHRKENGAWSTVVYASAIEPFINSEGYRYVELSEAIPLHRYSTNWLTRFRYIDSAIVIAIHVLLIHHHRYVIVRKYPN